MKSGVVYLLLAFLFSVVVNGQLQLSSEEKEWLSSSPVIKVANEDDWPPFDYSENGKAQGLSISYMDIVARKLGIKVEYINGHTWNELLLMSKNYQLDVLPCVWYAKEREEFINYSSPYISNPQVIVVNKKNSSIRNVEDLKHKKVAFIDDYASKDKIVKEFPEIEVLNVKSPLEALLLVNIGTVDAYIDSIGMVSYQIDKNLLTGLRIAGKLEMKGVENINNLYMGVRKDWPLLHSAIEKALKSITEEEKLALHDKWLMKIESDTKGEFQLFKADKKMLSQLEVLKTGFIESQAPIQYLGIENELKGISAEYISILKSKLNMPFEKTPYKNFQEGKEAVSAGKIDLLCSVIDKNDSGRLYSEPFLKVPVVLVTRKETTFIVDLETLEEKSVGFVSGVGLETKLQSSFNLKNKKFYNDVKEAFAALAKGEIYAFCSDAATAAYHLKKTNSSDFTIAHTTNFTFDVGFAVNKNQLQLKAVLDRFIASIPRADRLDIEHRWFNLFTEEGISIGKYWKEISVVCFILISIFLAFIFWNRSLSREIIHRQEVEKSLVAARHEAEKSNQAKSEFLAMMSHEIRTPLNGILGMSQLLAETELNEDQKQQCDVIVSSGESLLSIINDILDFSKIEAGKLEMETHPFNMNGLIDSVINLYKNSAEEKGLYLKTVCSPELFGSYKGDEGRLRQVILNLVSNAIKFTHEGGVTVFVEPVESVKNTEKISIRVKDTGIGIPEAVQSSLFQQFTQADTTTTRKYGGTGLGLAISKKIIDLMNGEIRIDSTLGEGTEFTVEILLSKSSTIVEEPEKKKEADQTFDGLKVLLVEDNVVNQKIALRVFDKLHCNVRLAGNGLEALEELKSFDPVMVFMDCHMPEMDGYETTREIRKNETLKNLPIIAMTANALQGDREKCLEAGMTDYLSKPFNKTKLVGIVKKYAREPA